MLFPIVYARILPVGKTHDRISCQPIGMLHARIDWLALVRQSASNESPINLPRFQLLPPHCTSMKKRPPKEPLRHGYSIVSYSGFTDAWNSASSNSSLMDLPSSPNGRDKNSLMVGTSSLQST